MESRGTDVVGSEAASEKPPGCACSCKNDILAAGLLLVLAMVAVLPGWLPGRVYVPAGAVERKDEQGQRSFDYLTGSAEAGAQWRAGNTPLWNSNRGVGVPIIGDGRTGIFDPLTMVHGFLPAGRAWTIDAMLRLWIAGMGAWLLTGRYQVRLESRLLTGIAYMLGGAMVGQLSLPEGGAAMMLPWAVWATLKLGEGVTAGRMLIAIVVFAMTILMGHLGAALVVLIACVMVALAHLGFGVNFTGVFGAIEWLPALLAAMVVAAAVTGAHWVPLMYNLTYYNGADVYEMGALAGRPGWMAMWVGIIAPILACGFAYWMRDRTVWAWYAVGGLAVLFAFGIPGVRRLVELRIGGQLLGHCGQMWMVVMLGVAVLSGFGLEAIGKIAGEAAGEVAREPAGWRKPTLWLALAGVELVVAAMVMHRGVSTTVWNESGPPENQVKWTAGRPPTRWELLSMLARAGDERLTPVPGRVMQWRKLAVESIHPMAGSVAKVWYEPRATLDNSIESMARKLSAEGEQVGSGLLLGSNYAADAELSSLTVRAAGYGDLGTLEVLSQSPSRLRLSVTNTRGYVVWAGAYAPGWSAETISTSDYVPRGRPLFGGNGPGDFSAGRDRSAEPTVQHRPTVVAPAYGVFRAVPVQAFRGSETELVIEYFPRGWKRGLFLSLAGGVLMLIMVGWTLFPKIE